MYFKHKKFLDKCMRERYSIVSICVAVYNNRKEINKVYDRTQLSVHSDALSIFFTDKIFYS